MKSKISELLPTRTRTAGPNGLQCIVTWSMAWLRVRLTFRGGSPHSYVLLTCSRRGIPRSPNRVPKEGLGGGALRIRRKPPVIFDGSRDCL